MIHASSVNSLSWMLSEIAKGGNRKRVGNIHVQQLPPLGRVIAGKTIHYGIIISLLEWDLIKKMGFKNCINYKYYNIVKRLHSKMYVHYPIFMTNITLACTFS